MIYDDVDNIYDAPSLRPPTTNELQLPRPESAATSGSDQTVVMVTPPPPPGYHGYTHRLHVTDRLLPEIFVLLILFHCPDSRHQAIHFWIYFPDPDTECHSRLLGYDLLRQVGDRSRPMNCPP